MSETLTLDLLNEIARMAIRSGATDAEVLGITNSEFSVEVRLGQVEKVHEANSLGIGIRVLKDGRQASCSTSSTSLTAIEELVATAVGMAGLTSIDEAAQLPVSSTFADQQAKSRLLELNDPQIIALSTPRKIEMARLTEESARSADPRITNSEGAACSTTISRSLLVNTAGFSGEYAGTTCSLMTAPIAGDGTQMQVGYRGDRQRHLRSLESPEEIGREAARRALRKLGARKIETQSAPVVFEAGAAEELLGSLFEAVNGSAIFRRASFLVGRLGEEIAVPALTVIDDGTMPGGLGSRPFDAEGVATRRTTVIDQGRLASYLLNTYTGRKLNLPSTGNAVRGLTGAPGVGPGNLYVVPGPHPPAEIIRSVRNGFYVTEMIGFGFNPVTGDYSRGAAGWWISEGELAFPVEEVTIAGNLRDMLRGIELVGNDLRFRGRIAAPTIRIDRMMISGN
jgi:PmbA protein